MALTPVQEQIVVELRKMLLSPFDDLLAVTRELVCSQATRSGLACCLRRHGVGPQRPQAQRSHAAPQSLQKRRAGVHPHRCQNKHRKTAAAARSILNAFHKAYLIKI